MSFNIGSSSKYPNRATVWEIEDHETWANVKISSSRRDKRITEGNQYINTNWFATFVGDAHNKISELKKGMRIEIVSGTVSQEPYMKDGVKTYPKSPKVTIFDFSILSRSEGGNSGFDKAPAVDASEDDQNIPF
jgi:hypothetical protein